MKRKNPSTGKPYRLGDKLADGKFFLQYDKSRLLKDGYFYERYCNEEKLQSNKYRSRINSRKQTERLKVRGKLNLVRRKNINTGQPFKVGDVEEGKYFLGYGLRQSSKDHKHYREKWTTD